MGKKKEVPPSEAPQAAPPEPKQSSGFSFFKGKKKNGSNNTPEVSARSLPRDSNTNPPNDNSNSGPYQQGPYAGPNDPNQPYGYGYEYGYDPRYPPPPGENGPPGGPPPQMMGGDPNYDRNGGYNGPAADTPVQQTGPPPPDNRPPVDFDWRSQARFEQLGPNQQPQSPFGDPSRAKVPFDPDQPIRGGKMGLGAIDESGQALAEEGSPDDRFREHPGASDHHVPPKKKPLAAKKPVKAEPKPESEPVEAPPVASKLPAKKGRQPSEPVAAATPEPESKAAKPWDNKKATPVHRPSVLDEPKAEEASLVNAKLPKHLQGKLDRQKKQAEAAPGPAKDVALPDVAAYHDAATPDVEAEPASKHRAKPPVRAPAVAAKLPPTESMSKPRARSPSSNAPQRKAPSPINLPRPRSSTKRRVFFPKSRIPTLKARRQQQQLQRRGLAFQPDQMLDTLQTLAANHAKVSDSIVATYGPRQQAPGYRKASEAILSIPSMPLEQKVMMLSERLDEEEEEVRKLHTEKTEYGRQVVSLRKRMQREVERSKPLPKVITMVPPSVEANLNLRYQFKRLVDHEREKTQKFAEENKHLTARVKELEAKQNATKHPPSSASNSHRNNEIVSLRKRLRESETEKRRLEELVHKVQSQLAKESKEKEKIDKDREAMRQQFTHLRGMDLEVGMDSTAAGLGGVLSRRASARLDVEQDVKRRAPVKKLGDGLRHQAKPAGDERQPEDELAGPSTQLAEQRKGAGELGKAQNERTVAGKPVRKPVVHARSQVPAQPSSNAAEDPTQEGHTEEPRKPQRSAKRPKAKQDRDGEQDEDQSTGSKGDLAGDGKGKLPGVFRTAPDRQRSVLANLDRDLREAGSLIDSLDQDLVRAADRTRQRRPTGEIGAYGSEDDGGVGVPNSRYDEYDRHKGSEALGAVPELPRQHRPQEDDGDERMRSAKIRAEYKIWVEKKKQEAAAAAAQAGGPIPNR
ncbi:uncharacterized protein EV422DRAFT_89578 [Fimicolochytrium jonesii]|uniref:uncharacterized protein n=1 Tax=Fimicolochytrium jonesii TaxID=1396493 RepID=UPI0022FF3CB0|nr:uncharacterized protein EV422DRAFT_89578 [Fimicolochytrium jonesii]KAI8819875.1 hypothetical protein EV422DRAFT_89578 [Fimicolochytrium jonesii]